MKIIIETNLMARLLCYAAATPNEFSGFGFCERKEGDIHVYDFVLLDVGTFGYTQIDPKRLLPLMQRPDKKNMKVWLHRHPLGNGVPGPHNWSGTDNMTILTEPLGSTPKDTQWSVSIVLTPSGFVGRIDNYVKNITQHLEVTPATQDFFGELKSLEAQSWAHQSSQGRGQRWSDWSENEDFPAQETSKRKRQKQTLPPKTGKKQQTGKRKTKASKLITALVTWCMKPFEHFVRITTHFLTHSPTFAKSTASIGPGSEGAPGTEINPDYGGK